MCPPHPRQQFGGLNQGFAGNTSRIEAFTAYLVLIRATLAPKLAAPAEVTRPAVPAPITVRS